MPQKSIKELKDKLDKKHRAMMDTIQNVEEEQQVDPLDTEERIMMREESDKIASKEESKKEESKNEESAE